MREAHVEASAEGTVVAPEYVEASPEALAEAETQESASGDMVEYGAELAPAGQEAGEPGEGTQYLSEPGEAIEGAEFFFLPSLWGLISKLVPLLVSKFGPSIAKRIL